MPKLFAMIVSLALVTAASAQLSDKDKDFVNKAAMGGQMEVDMGEFVVDKATDPDVKKFAKDHLPILKKHLELAEQTAKQVSGTGK